MFLLRLSGKRILSAVSVALGSVPNTVPVLPHANHVAALRSNEFEGVHLKKYQIALSIFLATATVFTVACSNSKTATTPVPSFTKMSFLSDRTADPATPLFVSNLDGTSAAGIVTNNGDWTYSPSTSADLTVLAYASDSEVWVTNTAGATPVQLTNNVTNNFYSQFVKVSPDGTMLLYSLYNAANNHILIMKPDGTGATDLTPTVPTAMTDCYAGSFSADSTKIVFSCSGDTTGGVYTMNIDGTDTTTIYTEASFLDDPIFSADGTKVLFVDYPGESASAHRRNLKVAPHSTVRSHVAHVTGTYGINSVNLDGTGLTTVAPNAYEAVILNSTLYYTIYDTNLELDQIYSSNLDGTNAVSLSDGTTEDYLGLSND